MPIPIPAQGAKAEALGTARPACPSSGVTRIWRSVNQDFLITPSFAAAAAVAIPTPALHKASRTILVKLKLS